MLAYVPLRGLEALKYVFLCSHDDYQILILLGFTTAFMVGGFKFFCEDVMGWTVGGKVDDMWSVYKHV